MRILFWILLASAAIVSCSKREEKLVSGDDAPIAGRWIYKQRFWSPGAGGSWNAVPTADQAIIEFTADGRFSYSPNFDKASLLFDRYRRDSNVVTVSSTANANVEKWYIQYIDNQQLDISLMTCFEGCPYRFIRN